MRATSAAAFAALCLTVLLARSTDAHRLRLRPGARPRVTAPPGMVLVRGATFVASGRRVRVDAFAIDRTEVTEGAWSACVAAGACAPLTSPPPHGRDLPARAVSHPMAEAYCAWRGARLPTNAEWLYAARGAGERSWPWGEAYVHAPLVALYDRGPSRVGSHPFDRSPAGALDMGGNVSEWVLDRVSSEEGGDRYYRYEPFGPVAPEEAPLLDNPSGQRDGTHALVQGGAWEDVADNAQLGLTTLRFDREEREPTRGFRCAVSLPPAPDACAR